MIRIALLAAVLATLAFAAGAAWALAPGAAPMIPYGAETIPGGPGVPNALMPGVPNAAGGGSFPPPPTCSNKLDFTQACNSQYIGAIL